MQAVHREAVQLVRQFHAAPPRQQPQVATALVNFCSRYPQGREAEWQDAAGRAGVVVALVQAAKTSNATLPHLMQFTKSSIAALQQEAVHALGFLVNNHHDNQSAAAAARAVPHLMQLTKSSNTTLQGSAVQALGCLVNNHHDNQSAAGVAGAVEHMCNLLSSYCVRMAIKAANTLTELSSLADNARRAVLMGAVALLLQLEARSGSHESIDQMRVKLVQVAMYYMAHGAAPPPMPSSKPAFSAAGSPAPAPVPAPARRLAPGSRVRIEGLQGRPEMNGRTGVICGRLLQASMLCSC